jgi:7,8-didemethyl-8-hydroxy-5-deazariboflavin synthase CofH subunit
MQPGLAKILGRGGNGISRGTRPGRDRKTVGVAREHGFERRGRSAGAEPIVQDGSGPGDGQAGGHDDKQKDKIAAFHVPLVMVADGQRAIQRIGRERGSVTDRSLCERAASLVRYVSMALGNREPDSDSFMNAPGQIDKLSAPPQSAAGAPASAIEPASALIAACPGDVRDYLAAVCEGAELSFQQGLRLATAEGAGLDALVAVADALRRETVGETLTYVVNRNINSTNVCFVGCSFCGFGRGPGAADAYSLSANDVARKAREAWEKGATEVCIQGGLPRDLDGFYYRDVLRAVKRAIPGMHVHAFSPMEISYGVDKTGMPLRDYLQMMKDEGLGSIPGTAAEILDDRVRQELSPNKLPVARWVEIITTAHELGIPTTSTMMYGHVEEPADWVRHILLLRSIQKRTGGFTEFVPLGFIHEKTRLYKHGGARAGARREEHLRVHALARVLLHGAIKNLQVSWVKLGFDVSLACLNAGANDFSGTLMEENISKAAGATFGEYVPPEEFRRMIRSIGRVPAERSTTYKIRRVFDAPEAVPAASQLQLVQAGKHVPYAEGAY